LKIVTDKKPKENIELLELQKDLINP